MNLQKEDISKLINFNNIRKIIRIIKHESDWEQTVPTEETMIQHVENMINMCKNFLQKESFGIDYIEISSKGFDVKVGKQGDISVTYDVDPRWWERSNGKITYDD